MELKDLNGLTKIHEGRFSIVFQATFNNEQFIVKQLHPRLQENHGQIKRFTSEASLFNKLNSSPCYYLKNQQGHFIIRHFVEGTTLKETLKKFSVKKNMERYLVLLKLIAEKLDRIHDAGFIHGDIKPSNILVSGFDSEPNVHLLDYGLSFEISSRPLKDSTNPLPFSMVYASPELMLNEPQMVDEKSDIFSLGIVMLEMFGNKPVYDSLHPAILMQMMLSVPLKAPKSIPVSMQELIQTITLKPEFKKPIAHYSIDEVRSILQANLRQRDSIPTLSEFIKRL